MAKKRSDKPGPDVRLAKSIGHPIRIEVMRVLNERTASPSQLAKALGQGVSHVSYHVQELSKYGCVEMVRTEPRRGAVEHFYRATRLKGRRSWYIDDEEARRLSPSDRAEITATTLQTMIGESIGALRSGSLNARADSHTSWLTCDLDEQGWREMTALLAETLERAQRIEASSAERARAGAGTFPAFMGLMAFERSREPSSQNGASKRAE
jgi:DNA-binding transcriptional ArsR family regulator